MAETIRNFAGNVIMLHNKSRLVKEPSKPMDSRAEQRGEPNQPNQGEAMSDQTWWKKELYGNVCGTDEAKVILSDIKMYERLEDLCERLEAAAEARGEERAYERQVREHPLFSIGYTKGEIDFGVNLKVADLSLEQMNSFRQMVVVGIGQAESMWRRGMEDRGLHEKGSSPTQGSSN